MSADEIKALVGRLREDAHWIWQNLNSRIGDRIEKAAAVLESLTLENQRLRVDAELMRQELKNIANADTVEWDDPTQYEAWAKSRARWALEQIEKEKT